MTPQQLLNLHQALNQHVSLEDWLIFCYDYHQSLYEKLPHLEADDLLWELLDWAEATEQNMAQLMAEFKQRNRTAYQRYLAENQAADPASTDSKYTIHAPNAKIGNIGDDAEIKGGIHFN